MTRRTKREYDHIEYVQEYLNATRGVWPRVVRELNELGIKASTQSLSVLCNSEEPNPLYKSVMGLYEYARGTGKKWRV